MILYATKSQVRATLDRVFAECAQLRDAGQAEYAGGDNAFGNFVRLGLELDLHPESVLWVYAKKHADGIAAFLRGHKSQREDVRGRINDLIVYLVLLRAMVDTREAMDDPVSEIAEPQEVSRAEVGEARQE